MKYTKHSRISSLHSNDSKKKKRFFRRFSARKLLQIQQQGLPSRALILASWELQFLVDILHILICVWWIRQSENSPCVCHPKTDRSVPTPLTGAVTNLCPDLLLDTVTSFIRTACHLKTVYWSRLAISWSRLCHFTESHTSIITPHSPSFSTPSSLPITTIIRCVSGYFFTATTVGAKLPFKSVPLGSLVLLLFDGDRLLC